VVLRHRCYRVGITPDIYQEVWESQKGLCALCGQKERHKYKGKVKELAIDHCHKSGKFRALLCHDCNTMLGMSKDSPALLRAAAVYLEERINL